MEYSSRTIIHSNLNPPKKDFQIRDDSRKYYDILRNGSKTVIPHKIKIKI